MNPVIRIWPPTGPTAPNTPTALPDAQPPLDVQAPLDDEALTEAYALTGSHSLRVNFVTSADGAVELDGFSAGLSGPADKRVFGILRMLCDALMVGAGTLRHEGYGAIRLDERRRAWRTARGLPAYPTLIVVSRGLDLDPAHDMFTGAPVRPVVLTCAASPAAGRAALAAVADVIVAGEQAVDLPAAVAALRARGLRHLLSEGGPRLFGGLTAADLVDELCLTVSPLLAGAGAGRITAGPRSLPRSLSLRHALAAGDMLLLRYARAAGPSDQLGRRISWAAGLAGPPD